MAGHTATRTDVKTAAGQATRLDA